MPIGSQSEDSEFLGVPIRHQHLPKVDVIFKGTKRDSVCFSSLINGHIWESAMFSRQGSAAPDFRTRIHFVSLAREFRSCGIHNVVEHRPVAEHQVDPEDCGWAL